MKKVVRYDPTSVLGGITTGAGVLLRPYNHYSNQVSNTGLVYTSNVVSIGEFGVFETANSHYVPQAKPKELK